MVLLLAGLALARPDVAVLLSDDLDAYEAPVARFTEAVGRPVTVFDLRGSRARADAVVRQLRADPPPLVLALGAKAAFVAAHELEDVPTVYAMVTDPDRYGLEGEHVTGVSAEIPAAAVLSQFALFAPGVRRIGVLVSAERDVTSEVRAARRVGLEPRVEEVASRREVRSAFARLAREVDALWLVSDPTVLSPETFRWLRSETLRRRMPMLASTENLVRAGALVCVAPDRGVLGEQAAGLARRILDGGETPGDIAPPPPESLRVVLNRDTLDAVGIEVDELMLELADEVVREPARR